MGFRWTAWMPLMAAHPLAMAQLPSMPGIYRIRRRGSPDHLEWIAWEGRGVREVVERLARQVHMPVRPYDDPTGPALRLWELRLREGTTFEVSGTALSIGPGEGPALARSLREAHLLRLDPLSYR